MQYNTATGLNCDKNGDKMSRNCRQQLALVVSFLRRSETPVLSLFVDAEDDMTRFCAFLFE